MFNISSPNAHHHELLSPCNGSVRRHRLRANCLRADSRLLRSRTGLTEESQKDVVNDERARNRADGW